MSRTLFTEVFWQRTLWILKSVTGRFLTSCLQTSQVLLPLILNHFTAHSWWARARAPLQLHSILRVSPPSHNSTKQIRQTASSSGMSSPSSSVFSVRYKWGWYQREKVKNTISRNVIQYSTSISSCSCSCYYWISIFHPRSWNNSEKCIYFPDTCIFVENWNRQRSSYVSVRPFCLETE